MRNVKSLCVGLILLFVSSCQHPPPLTELCLTGDDYKLVCNDPRLPEEEQDYEREYTLDYVCTSPSDYNTLYDYVNRLREKLKKRCKD